MRPVCPVPTRTALMPRSLSARVRIVAVVRLPIAPSVPSTAMRGQVTSAMLPLNMRRSFLSRGRRTSRIVTSCAAAAAANSGSSFRNSCRPLTMFIPRADGVEHDAALERGRACRSVGAIPRMKKSGTRPASAIASRQVGADRDAVRLVVEHRRRRRARPSRCRSPTRISYFSEWRTRPLAVLPSQAPKIASQ